MKLHSHLYGALAVGCVFSIALPQRAAAVTDEEFNALKDLVSKQGQRIQQLEQTHDRDQQVHSQDAQQLQQLRQQLGETQILATNAVQKAEAAAQLQPTKPVAGGISATHNFMMVGDAEVSFAKFSGQHSSFALADFAPIFLYRAGDKVLFEAGFDITLSNNRGHPIPPGAAGSGATTGFDMSFAQLDYPYVANPGYWDMKPIYDTFAAGDTTG